MRKYHRKNPIRQGRMRQHKPWRPLLPHERDHAPGILHRKVEPYSLRRTQHLPGTGRLPPKGKYPGAKLYVAGNSILGHGTLKEKLKLPAYGKYLLSLIKKYHLEDSIILLGKLNAEEMKQQFLKSSVFLCPSVLENSPNTVGEAQLLGVPVAASMTGGIPDMIEDGKDGLLFPVGDVKEMAEQIETLWNRTKGENGLCFAEHISEGARRKARITHDGEANYLRLLEIYDKIVLNQP